MRIVIAASEAVPFAKTGGLADVAGALPKALFRLGHEPILFMPLYREVRRSGADLTEIGRVEVPVGRGAVDAGVWHARIPGTGASAYFIEHDAYFDRDNLYANEGRTYSDNCERYAFFCRGVLEAVGTMGLVPHVFHVQDWQTALIAPYLRILHGPDSALGRSGVLLTIHNVAHQGIFRHWDMDLIGLDWKYFNWRQFEFWGKINLLKAGIVFADILNTVSPTYAREIQTEQNGHGLDGVLRERRDLLHGVVNGIDDAVWNPAADPHITADYGSEDVSPKASCKRALQRQAGLPLRKVPVAGVVSRFDFQKGLDLVAKALPRVFDREPLQFVILGNGDQTIRMTLDDVARRYPDRMRVFARHDDRLAHRIIAGSDMLLVPSRFEPCGLTQLYGLKYGSVPVVRETGGLADTVCDCTPDTLSAGRATGFTFKEPTPEALAQCLLRALGLYRDGRSWRRLMETGMAQDWSWEASARQYLRLYDAAKALRFNRRPALAGRAEV